MNDQFGEFSVEAENILKIPSSFLMHIGLDVSKNQPLTWSKRFGILAGTVARYIMFSLGAVMLMFGTMHALFKEKSVPTRMLTLAIVFRKFSSGFKIMSMKKNIGNLMDLIDDVFCDIKFPKTLLPEVKAFKQSCKKTPVDLYLFVLFILILILPLVFYSTFTWIERSETGPPLLVTIVLPRTTGLSNALRVTIYSAQIIIVSLFGIGLFGYTLLFLAMLILGLKALQHLNAVIRTLHSEDAFDINPDHVDENNPDYEEVRQVLNYAIQQHQRCIRFIDGVNKIFSNAILIEVWVVLSIFFSVIHYIVRSETVLNSARIVVLGQNVMITGVEFGMKCWYSNKIITESLRVNKNCNSTSWWNWVPGFELDVSIMAIRSKEPLCINAGPLYLLSLKTLLTILELSISYLLILLQL